MKLQVRALRDVAFSRLMFFSLVQKRTITVQNTGKYGGGGGPKVAPKCQLRHVWAAPIKEPWNVRRCWRVRHCFVKR